MTRAAVLRWALPAAFLFLIFLVSTLPARHVLGWLGGAQLAVQDVEGTPWRGRLQRLAFERTQFGPVVWQLRLPPLLTGRLEYQLFVQSGRGGGELRAGRALFGAPYIHDAQLSLSAAEVARQLRLTLVGLGGDFLVDVDTLRLTGAWPSALRGELRWQDALLLSPQPLGLGNLHMQLDLREGQVVGSLGDAGGPLELAGEFILAPDRSYRLDALLQARAGAAAPLREALSLLGKPDAQGRYRLRYSGTL
ncbi:MAG: type II secretion system protein N [Gammaproteobacteria bacterium]